MQQYSLRFFFLNMSMNEGAPCPADEERGEVHLEVGAGADQQQHHRHKRVEVEQRRLHPTTTPPPLSGMEEEGTWLTNPHASRAQINTEIRWRYHGNWRGGGSGRRKDTVAAPVGGGSQRRPTEQGKRSRFPGSFLLFLVCERGLDRTAGIVSLRWHSGAPSPFATCFREKCWPVHFLLAAQLQLFCVNCIKCFILTVCFAIISEKQQCFLWKEDRALTNIACIYPQKKKHCFHNQNLLLSKRKGDLVLVGVSIRFVLELSSWFIGLFWFITFIKRMATKQFDPLFSLFG